MILAPQALPEQVGVVLEAAVVALRAAAEDGSEVAAAGLQDVLRFLEHIGGVYVPPSSLNADVPEFVPVVAGVA